MSVVSTKPSQAQITMNPTEECVKDLIAHDFEMAMAWRLCRNKVRSTFQNADCPVTLTTEKARSLHRCTVLRNSHLPNCEVKRRKNN